MNKDKPRIPKFRIRRIDGYKVIDRDGNQISPDMLGRWEAEDWIKERRKDAKYY